MRYKTGGNKRNYCLWILGLTAPLQSFANTDKNAEYTSSIYLINHHLKLII